MTINVKLMAKFPHKPFLNNAKTLIIYYLAIQQFENPIGTKLNDFILLK